MATSMNLKLLEQNKIHELRWIASEAMAVDRMRNNWPIIVTDLKAIQLSKDFDKEAKRTAQGYYNKLVEIPFLFLLHFMCDLLDELSIVSRQMQERYGLLPDQWDIHQNLRDKLEHLKMHPGPKLQEFIDNCKCFNTVTGQSVPITCTLESITTANKVTFRSIEISMKGQQINTRRGSSRVPTLDDFRDDILENLITFFNARFPSESLESFKAS